MAINRIWQAGAETSSVLEFDDLSNYWSVVASPVYTGTYAFQASAYSGLGTTYSYGIQYIPVTRQIRGGFFIYGNTALGNYMMLFRVRSDVGANLLGMECSGNGNTNTIALNVADVIQDSALNLWQAGWFHIGFDIKLDNAAGWFNIYKDGKLVLNFSGNTGNADMAILDFGFSRNRLIGNQELNVNVQFDDIYVDDTTGEGSANIPPVKVFEFLAVNVNGNYSQWDGSDGNSVDNYQLVDEIPANDADYVETYTVDELDSYGASTIVVLGNQLIDAVIPIARTQRFGSTEELALGTRYSSTDVVGSGQVPTLSPSYKWERQVEKPGGGDWDQTAVDGVELVIKSRGSY